MTTATVNLASTWFSEAVKLTMCDSSSFYCFSNCEGDISSIDKNGLHGIFLALQHVVDDSDYNFLPSIILITNYLTQTAIRCKLGGPWPTATRDNALLLRVREMALSQKCT